MIERRTGLRGGAIISVLTAVVLSLLTPMATAAASTLLDVAAGMTPGIFVELTSMTGWNNGRILNPPGCAGGDVITQYANTAVWNPIAKRFQFSGSPHNPCSGTNEMAVAYNDATNTWSALPTPPGGGNDPRHSYGHNALNPATGEHYYTHYNSLGLVRLNSAGTSWSTLASRTGNVQCCRAQAWFPELSGGRLIHVDGDWGIRAYNPATNSWTQLSRGNGSDGTGLPQFTGDSQPAFAHHSARCHCVVFGGASSFHKLNSDGTFTTLTQSGGPGSGLLNIGPNNSSIVTDPVTGRLLFISSGVMREFDPGTTNASTGSWSTVGVTIPSFFNTGGSTSESLISAAIADYGVVMYVKHDDSGTGRVFLYKHAPSLPTPPPAAPRNVTAQ